MTTPMLPTEDTTKDFEKTLNDDEAALSDEDRYALEIVNRTIKRVDKFKLQIAIPLRHISLNLPDNILIDLNNNKNH